MLKVPVISGAAQFKSSKAFIAASSEYFAEKLDEISSQLEVCPIPFLAV